MSKVLFIVGPGRSGSTLVAELLGQFDAIVNAGEMFWYFNKVGVVPPSRCGCGLPLGECAIWQEVIAGSPAAQNLSSDDLHDFYAMRPIASWPKLFWQGRHGLSNAKNSRILGQMYAALASSSGADLVVDASKLPGIGLVAASIPDVDLYVLHLTRDPRSVVNAWRTPKLDVLSPSDNLGRRPAWQVIWWWVARSLAAEWLLKRRVRPGHFLRLQYEQFADAPRETIEAIIQFVGVDDGGTPFSGPDQATILHSHTVIGNPDRHSTGELTITRRDRWRDELPFPTRLITGLATWPAMRWFGLGRPPSD